MSYLKLIFVWIVREGLTLILFPRRGTFVSAKLIFLIKLLWHLCWKTVDYISMGLFWTLLCFTDLFSILLPTPPYSDYRNFVKSLGIRQCGASIFALLSQDCLVILDPSLSCIYFRNVHFYKNSCRYFIWDCTESIWKKLDLSNNIESSSPRTSCFSSLIKSSLISQAMFCAIWVYVFCTSFAKYIQTSTSEIISIWICCHFFTFFSYL